MHVLITNDAYQAAIACIQSMGRAGHRVSVIVAGKRPAPASFSNYVGGRFPKFGVAGGAVLGTADSLVQLVEREKIDLVIPISDRDAWRVARAAQQEPDAKAFSIVPSVESVDIAFDKIATHRFAASAGVLMPPWVVCEARSDVAAAVEGFGLPAVVKVPIATASKGTFVVRTLGEVERVVATLPAGPILVEAFVAGIRVDATAFAWKGRVIERFGFRHWAGIEAEGTPVYAFSDDDQKAAAVLEGVCRHLNWTGGIDLDLIRDEAGGVHLLEINPRFSGTLVFADKLGIDLPLYYAEAVAGASFHPPAPTPPNDILFVTAVPTEAQLVAQDPDRWKPVATDLRARHRHVDNAYPDDGPLTAAQRLMAQAIERQQALRKRR